MYIAVMDPYTGQSTMPSTVGSQQQQQQQQHHQIQQDMNAYFLAPQQHTTAHLSSSPPMTTSYINGSPTGSNELLPTFHISAGQPLSSSPPMYQQHVPTSHHYVALSAQPVSYALAPAPSAPNTITSVHHPHMTLHSLPASAQPTQHHHHQQQQQQPQHQPSTIPFPAQEGRRMFQGMQQHQQHQQHAHLYQQQPPQQQQSQHHQQVVQAIPQSHQVHPSHHHAVHLPHPHMSATYVPAHAHTHSQPRHTHSPHMSMPPPGTLRTLNTVLPSSQPSWINAKGPPIRSLVDLPEGVNSPKEPQQISLAWLNAIFGHYFKSPSGDALVSDFTLYSISTAESAASTITGVVEASVTATATAAATTTTTTISVSEPVSAPISQLASASSIQALQQQEANATEGTSSSVPLPHSKAEKLGEESATGGHIGVVKGVKMSRTSRNTLKHWPGKVVVKFPPLPSPSCSPEEVNFLLRLGKLHMREVYFYLVVAPYLHGEARAINLGLKPLPVHIAASSMPPSSSTSTTSSNGSSSPTRSISSTTKATDSTTNSTSSSSPQQQRHTRHPPSHHMGHVLFSSSSSSSSPSVHLPRFPVPRLYHGFCSMEDKNYDGVLVMEDLTTSAGLASFKAGLTYEQMRSALKSISTLHTLTLGKRPILGVNQNEEHLKSMRSLIWPDEPEAELEESLSFMSTIVGAAVEDRDDPDGLIEYIRGEMPVEYLDRLLSWTEDDSNIRSSVEKWMGKGLSEGGQAYLCLTHGDLWSNNLMWSTNPHAGTHHHRARAHHHHHAHHHQNRQNNNSQVDENGNPSTSLPSAHLKGIVDFQTMSWAHPLSDVLVLLFSSFSSSKRGSFITDCLAHYRSHFKRSSGGQLYSDTRVFDTHVQELIPHTLSWLIASWTIFKEEPEDVVVAEGSEEKSKSNNNETLKKRLAQAICDLLDIMSGSLDISITHHKKREILKESQTESDTDITDRKLESH